MDNRTPEGPSRSARRLVSEEEYQCAKDVILPHLAKHRAITNREFRALTQLSSDQAVTCFNRMIAEGLLVRVGKTTNTKYLLRGAAEEPHKDQPVPTDDPPTTSGPVKGPGPGTPASQAFICELGRDLFQPLDR
jgi:hypothetical protein